jgi:hypothetical protein
MSNWARLACLGVGIALWIAGASSAHAQIPGYQMDRSKTPTFSPYLNLVRGGSSPAINYYGIVRPEIQFGNSLYQLGVQQDLLQGQQNALSQQNTLAAYSQLPTTGHASGFMTQSRYFMTNGGVGQVGNTFAPGGFGPGPQLPAGNPGSQITLPGPRR